MNEKVTPPESMSEAIGLIWEYQQTQDNEIADSSRSVNMNRWSRWQQVKSLGIAPIYTKTCIRPGRWL